MCLHYAVSRTVCLAALLIPQLIGMSVATAQLSPKSLPTVPVGGFPSGLCPNENWLRTFPNTYECRTPVPCTCGEICSNQDFYTIQTTCQVTLRDTDAGRAPAVKREIIIEPTDGKASLDRCQEQDAGDTVKTQASIDSITCVVDTSSGTTTAGE